MKTCSNCSSTNWDDEKICWKCETPFDIELPIGLKPSRYIPELEDWLKQVNKVLEKKKREENGN